jgi:phosphatidylglycerophosphate synthase
MPSKLRLRPFFAPIVKQIGILFSKLGMTPNIATVGMLICATTSVVFLFLNKILWFGIFLFITGIMDGVDGAIARHTGKKSNFGGFFDSTMDRLSEAIIFGGLLITQEMYFTVSNTISTLFIVLSVIGCFMISYMRARAELIQKGYDTNIGLMARSERLFFLFIVSLISHFSGLEFFTYGFLTFTILVILTAVYRFYSYRIQIMGSE